MDTTKLRVESLLSTSALPSFLRDWTRLFVFQSMIYCMIFLLSLFCACTMRAEIIAYMIYSEGPEYPEYEMHFFT